MAWVRLGLSLTVVALSLAACARTAPEQPRASYKAPRPDPVLGTTPSPRVVEGGQRVPRGGGAYKIGAPYQVAGRWYYPREQPRLDETGIASWYGTEFHGRKTANGEIFNQNELTAAHKTLPLPSLVRVTNLANGRSVVVRINDRGPFHPGRIMDVSYAAAHRLGYASKGSAEVLVEALRPGERIEDQGAVPGAAARPAENVMSAAPPQKSASRPEGLWLQLGAFRERANAEKMRKSVAEHLGEFPERLEIFEHRGAWRLGLGPLRDDSALRSTQSRLLELTGVRAIPLKP